MYKALAPFVFLAACVTADGSGVTLPFGGPLIGNAAYSEDRAAVELFVKTNHPALIADIGQGSGPYLTKAMDLASIPVEDRPARVIQLQGNLGLYHSNPGALVSALMLYGR